MLRIVGRNFWFDFSFWYRGKLSSVVSADRLDSHMPSIQKQIIPNQLMTRDVMQP